VDGSNLGTNDALLGIKNPSKVFHLVDYLAEKNTEKYDVHIVVGSGVGVGMELHPYVFLASMTYVCKERLFNNPFQVNALAIGTSSKQRELPKLIATMRLSTLAYSLILSSSVLRRVSHAQADHNPTCRHASRVPDARRPARDRYCAVQRHPRISRHYAFPLEL
jgi:hypothetical protein